MPSDNDDENREHATGAAPGLNAGQPSAPAAPRGIPTDVTRVLSHLANLIDERLKVRGSGVSIKDFAARFLEVDHARLTATTREMSGLTLQLALLAFADLMDRHEAAAVIGEDEEEPPRWEVLELGDVKRRVPYRLAAAFDQGTVAACPIVVAAAEAWDGDFVVTVYSRAGDSEVAGEWLQQLLAASRAANPFRGRMLGADWTSLGLTFSVVTAEPVARADLVLPDGVWADVDRHVHRLFANVERLRSAGLSANRGILLEGPPGTGKTMLCRAVANECPTDVTVVVCSSKTLGNGVGVLYEALEHLAPALVVMEDIDLVVGSRRHGASGTLVDFLVALDGAMSRHSGVVTIATTNDVAAIDEAATRAARFDVVVGVPVPDAVARERILDRYLAGLVHDVDSVRVAAATDGATGADLRELVTLAVLHTTGEEPVITEMLLRLAVERRHGTAPPGQYL